MSENKPPLFIHIPKCAGRAMQDICLKHNKEARKLCTDNFRLKVNFHRPASFYTDEVLSNHFVFTFVRNPFERLLSAYEYIFATQRLYAVKHQKKYNFMEIPNNFTSFVKNFITLIPLERSLVHFVTMKTFLDRNVDFIGRYENLNQDHKILLNKLNIPYKPIPLVNETKTKKDRKHYTEYYNDETRKIVEDLYKDDLSTFDYKFGD